MNRAHNYHKNIKMYVLRFNMRLHHFSQFPFNAKKNSKRNPFHSAPKNGARRCKYCCAVVSSWAIKQLDLKIMAGLWLPVKYSIMSGFMDIRRSRVARRYSVGLVCHETSPTKASDAKLWCFVGSAPEQTVEQTIETPVIWDPIALIMTSL